MSIATRVALHSALKVKDINTLIDSPGSIVVHNFDEAGADKFCTEFMALANKQEIIPITIDSYGGYVDSLFRMIDTIQSMPEKKIATVVVGKAMSCGAALMTCGSPGYRFCAPNARIMIHDASSGTHGKVGDMEVSVNETKRLNKQIDEVMEKNLKLKPGSIQKLLAKVQNRDLYITAQEAKKLKLIDHIKVPSFKVEVDVRASFG